MDAESALKARSRGAALLAHCSDGLRALVRTAECIDRLTASEFSPKAISSKRS
jgi:hypothetical protein